MSTIYERTPEQEFADRSTRQGAIDREHAREIGTHEKAIADIDAEMAREVTVFRDKWGVIDGDSRRIYARARFDREDHECALRLNALRDQRTQHQGEIETLKRRKKNWGPLPLPPISRLHVPAIDAPRVDEDQGLAAFAAERTRVTSERERDLSAIADLEPLIASYQGRAAECELRIRHNLAKPEAARAAQKDVDDAERALRGYHDRVASSDARLAEIDRLETELRAELERTVREKVKQAIVAKMREAADFLVPALGAIAQLDALFAEDLAPSRTWRTGEFDLDHRALVPDVSAARHFLDTAHEFANWRPASGGKK
jgi:hypothetical protein